MLRTLIVTALAVRVLTQINDAFTTALPHTGSGSTASAGDLAALPACAQTCLANSTSSQGSCSSVDIKCLCGNSNYIAVLACCLATQCNPKDQDTAAAFNGQLCASVNITIPNYIGCPDGSNARGGNTSSPSSTSGSNLADTGTATTKKGTPTGTLEPQLSLVTTGAVATFKGGKLFTGSCTETQFASMTLPAGGVLEYPWLGCSEEGPGCCPFNPKSRGPLSICPDDYVTMSGACCPSGWSVYSTAFAGATPCATSVRNPIFFPSNTSSPHAAVSIITNELFTFRYPLAAKSKKLASGAVAGIAIGSLSGVALALAAAALLLRKRRAKAHADREAATLSQSENNTKGRSELDSTSAHDGKGGLAELPSPHADSKSMSELPSPHSQTLPDRPVWSYRTPTSPTGKKGEVFEMAAAPPAEMAGDMYMDQHHPAHERQSPAGAREQGLRGSAKVEASTTGVGEDLEEATPAYTPTSGKMLGPVADEPFVVGDDDAEEKDLEDGKDSEKAEDGQE